jgi:hypothetical protein
VCDDAAVRRFLERGLNVKFVMDAARGIDDDRVAACTIDWANRGLEFTTAAEVAGRISG